MAVAQPSFLETAQDPLPALPALPPRPAAVESAPPASLPPALSPSSGAGRPPALCPAEEAPPTAVEAAPVPVPPAPSVWVRPATAPGRSTSSCAVRPPPRFDRTHAEVLLRRAAIGCKAQPRVPHRLLDRLSLVARRELPEPLGKARKLVEHGCRASRRRGLPHESVALSSHVEAEEAAALMLLFPRCQVREQRAEPRPQALGRRPAQYFAVSVRRAFSGGPGT